MKFPRKQLEKYSKSSKQVEIYWYLISEYLIFKFNKLNLLPQNREPDSLNI